MDFSLLTERQMQFVRELCRGRSNAQIAADHFVAASTAKNTIYDAYRALGLEEIALKDCLVCHELGRADEREGRSADG